ncbi:hypothetical protein FKP32DRAFT_1000704 [Trametes sanguinea]|nr:hypothetical protein FKP32DRAFT_1000704 [Trametes sanguinea]
MRGALMLAGAGDLSQKPSECGTVRSGWLGQGSGMLTLSRRSGRGMSESAEGCGTREGCLERRPSRTVMSSATDRPKATGKTSSSPRETKETSSTDRTVQKTVGYGCATETLQPAARNRMQHDPHRSPRIVMFQQRRHQGRLSSR